MQNRKLYKLLALFSEEERSGFAAYLSSPLFNSSPTLIRFYALWQERLLGRGQLDPGSHYAENLLAGSKLIPERMDKYCSGLYKKALDFLAVQEFQKSTFSRMEMAAKALEHREGLRKQWEEQRQHMQEHLEQSPASADKKLQHLRFTWKSAESRIHTRETKSLWQEDFKDLHQAADSYYYLQKLRLACATTNARLIYKQEEDPAREFLQSFRQQKDKLNLDPLTEAYWLALNMISEEGEGQFFQQLFALLQDQGHSFSGQDARELFNYALNYCLRRGNKGEVQFQKYSAALYRELLTKEIILIEGKLPAQTMKNIVVIHCMVGEMDWVEGFLEEFKDRLLSGTDPHLIVYNQAVLAFYREQYPQAIEGFKKVISQLKGDVFYEIDARIYLLKAYFEDYNQLSMEGVDEMYRMYDSFRIYIDRNQKISRQHKLRYGNFIREFKRFMKILERKPLQRDRLQKLHKQVSETELMVNKSWFLEKLKTYQKPAL